MIRCFKLIIFVVLNLCNEAYSLNHASIPTDVLYHGSSNSMIEVLEPRQSHVRDNTEGEVIFASPSIKIASCFLFRWDDSWVNLTISSNDEDKSDFTVRMIISDRKEFNKRDRGGSIYLLPAENFTFEEDKGLGVYEWTSQDKTIPYGKIVFSSSLDAMTKLGVKVYFVTSEQFETYLKLSGEKQEAFLNKLEAN